MSENGLSVSGERNAILQPVFFFILQLTVGVSNRPMLIKKSALDPSETFDSRSKSALDWTHQKLDVTHSPTMTHLLGWQGLQNSELKKPRGPEILQLLHKLGPQLQQSCQIGDFWRAFVNVPWTSLQVRQDRGGCHSMLVEFLVV